MHNKSHNDYVFEPIIQITKTMDKEKWRFQQPQPEPKPLSDAIEFAEYLSGEGYQQYDGKERWIAPHNSSMVYTTEQLYKMFKSSIKL